METGPTLAERLLHLRQHQEDGRRSPHKPLLVLLALGKIAHSGSSRLEWSEVESRLAELLEEFGPPRKGGPKPEYPFTRLRSDMVWELSREVPMDKVSHLRTEPISGHFVRELEDYFDKHPNEVFSTARLLVEQQFPTTVSTDVLAAVGLDPDAVLASNETQLPNVEQRRRSSAWRHAILQAWDRSCAFCGFDGQVGRGSVGVEAAHIRWFNFGGPDTLDNGLALCSLHHKLLDRGVLGFADSQTIVVSQTFTARSDEGRRVYQLHGLSLRARPGTDLPLQRHIEWHVNEVFKDPPLALNAVGSRG